MSYSSSGRSPATRSVAPRLPRYGGGPVIAGRAVHCGTARLPTDFGQRLDRLKRASGLTWDQLAEALGLERKTVLSWRTGAEPCGGSYHALIELARWIPGGIEILLGEGFLETRGEG